MTTPRFDNLSEKELYANPPLWAYLTNVHRRHEYIHLLGLPSRKDRPNLPIELMFVQPVVSLRSISVDSDPNDWMNQCESIYAALDRHRRVLLLGDPGMGKTTLFNRLAWELTFAQRNGPFVRRFGWMLPLPMVLRELPLEGVTAFDGLLNAFISQPIGEPLRDSDLLQSMLEQGRALLMLDGIDELGTKRARVDLRAAVYDGMRRFPDCLWLLSSRIVGYGEVPFGRQLKPAQQDGVAVPDDDRPAIYRHYIAPFDNRRIRSFVHNWYALRDGNAHKSGRASDLVEAIRRDESLHRLARNPNVLAMMALVHRMEATLPHERSVLYKLIVDAYLESIDKHRGISGSTLDLPRKRMWLARVGYEMQRRRAHDAESDMVASCDDVQNWFHSEMDRSRVGQEAVAPREFLSFLARRSGLLIPKEDDQYAFNHLSFQEYLAAVLLECEVTGPLWAKSGRSTLGFDRGLLASMAWQASWLETFCFLFEMLADRPEWHAELLGCVFGEDFALLDESDADEGLFNIGFLAARLSANPHSGLSPRDRRSAFGACVRTQIRCSNYFFGSLEYDGYLATKSIFALLMDGRETTPESVLASIRDYWVDATNDLESPMLDLRQTEVHTLDLVADLHGLEVLILTDTNVRDLGCAKGFKDVHWLELGGTPVEDVSAIAQMPELRFLNIEGTNVSDLRPLAQVRSLEAVLLSDTPTSGRAIVELQKALPNCDIVKDS